MACESRGISLQVGNPRLGPASYTVFALPFVWSLQDVVRKPARSYKPLPKDAEHRRYFTPETANALFDRAQWYELEAEDATPSGVYRRAVLHLPAPSSQSTERTRDIEIALGLPRLVLFESENPHRRRDSIVATGFLLVELHFPSEPILGEAPTLDDLLTINELFRYWRRPFRGHESRYLKVMSDLEPASGEGAYISRWTELFGFPVEIKPGAPPRRLIAKKGSAEAIEWLQKATGKKGWIAYTDHRAFVWTCVQTTDGAKALRGIRAGRDPKFSPEWVRLLNVDPPIDGDVTDFEREWITERTYERWKHFGTLYGFNTHAGAMISDPRHEPPLWRHFGDLYLHQILLLLYLRVSTFRFSDRLAEISGDLPKAAAKFRALRQEFAALTNLYRFPLISSQQQGIEMYAYARRSLDIDELFEEVQTEIQSTHEMFELVNTQKMAKTTVFLTYLVLVAGVFATLMAFLAAEDLENVSPPRELLLRLADDVFRRWIPDWAPTPAWSLILLTALALFSVVAVSKGVATFLSRRRS